MAAAAVFSFLRTPAAAISGYVQTGFPDPWVWGPFLIMLLIAAPVVWILFLYMSSRMRFVLFDSIIAKRCEIGKMWRQRGEPAMRFFVWQIVFAMVSLAGLALVVGVPALIGFALGWFTDPRSHLAGLILGGIIVFFAFMAWLLLVLVAHVFTKDFVVPQMALEEISAFEGWSRLLGMVQREKAGYAGYAGMKLLMSIGAGIAVGMAAFILLLGSADSGRRPGRDRRACGTRCGTGLGLECVHHHAWQWSRAAYSSCCFFMPWRWSRCRSSCSFLRIRFTSLPGAIQSWGVWFIRRLLRRCLLHRCLRCRRLRRFPSRGCKSGDLSLLITCVSSVWIGIHKYCLFPCGARASDVIPSPPKAGEGPYVGGRCRCRYQDHPRCLRRDYSCLRRCHCLSIVGSLSRPADGFGMTITYKMIGTNLGNEVSNLSDTRVLERSFKWHSRQQAVVRSEQRSTSLR